MSTGQIQETKCVGRHPSISIVCISVWLRLENGSKSEFFNCNKEKSFGSNKRHGVEHLLSINKKTVKTSTLLDINYHHVVHHPLISMPSKQVTTLSVSGSSSLFLFWPIKERPTKSSRDLGLPSLLGLYISAGTRTRQSKLLPSESMKVTVKSLSCFSWQKRPDFPINRLRLKSSTSVSRSWKRLLPPPNGKNKKSGDTVDGSEILHHLVYMKS